MTFLPAKDPDRCTAVMVNKLSGHRLRCPEKRWRGGELCREHKEAEDSWGLRVPRVKRPEVSK